MRTPSNAPNGAPSLKPNSPNIKGFAENAFDATFGHFNNHGLFSPLQELTKEADKAGAGLAGKIIESEAELWEKRNIELSAYYTEKAANDELEARKARSSFAGAASEEDKPRLQVLENLRNTQTGAREAENGRNRGLGSVAIRSTDPNQSHNHSLISLLDVPSHLDASDLALGTRQANRRTEAIDDEEALKARIASLTNTLKVAEVELNSLKQPTRDSRRAPEELSKAPVSITSKSGQATVVYESVAGGATSYEDNIKFNEYNELTKRTNSGGLNLNPPLKNGEKPMIIGGTRVDQTAYVDYNGSGGKGRIYIKEADHDNFKSRIGRGDNNSLLDLFSKRAECSSIRVHRPDEKEGKTIEITTKGNYDKDLNSVTVHLSGRFHAKLQFHNFEGEYALDPKAIKYFKETNQGLVQVKDKEDLKEAQNLLGSGGYKIKVTNISTISDKQDQFTKIGRRNWFTRTPSENAPKVSISRANSLFLDQTDWNRIDGKEKMIAKISTSDRSYFTQPIYLAKNSNEKYSIRYGNQEPASWSEPSKWTLSRKGWLYNPNFGKVEKDNATLNPDGNDTEGAKIRLSKVGRNLLSTTNVWTGFSPDKNKSDHLTVTTLSEEGLVAEVKIQKKASWIPGGWGKNILRDKWTNKINAELDKGAVEGRSGR